MIVKLALMALLLAGVASAQQEQAAKVVLQGLKDEVAQRARGGRFPTAEQLERLKMSLAYYPESFNDRAHVERYCTMKDGLPPIIYLDAEDVYGFQSRPSLCSSAASIALDRRIAFLDRTIAFRAKYPNSMILVMDEAGRVLCEFDEKQPDKCNIWREKLKKMQTRKR